MSWPVRLSGGNQQKLIIGREVDRNPELLIAALPTRGLDVGAIEFIHKRLIEQRDNGKAVLLISFELDEVMNVSDRIAVIYDGQIVDTVIPTETTEQELGLLMAGQSRRRRATCNVKEGEDRRCRIELCKFIGTHHFDYSGFASWSGRNVVQRI